jgi:hypothetical protein
MVNTDRYEGQYEPQSFSGGQRDRRADDEGGGDAIEWATNRAVRGDDDDDEAGEAIQRAEPRNLARGARRS